MKHIALPLLFIPVFFLCLSANHGAWAQDTLSAPPPGGDVLGIEFQRGATPPVDTTLHPAPQQNAPAISIPSQEIPAPSTVTEPSAQQILQHPQTTTAPPAAPAPQLGILSAPTGNRGIAPTDIPEEVLAEMARVESDCSQNFFYSSFHDCRCIAVKFVDERMKRGPDVAHTTILTAVTNECPNIPGAAGYIYASCSQYMDWTNPVEDSYCRCTANRVAEKYGKAPRMNTRYIQRLRRDAMVECGRPGSAQPGAAINAPSGTVR